MYNLLLEVYFFKQKTAYEMRISDWSSDVCSSDLFAEQFLEFRMIDALRRRDRRQHQPNGCSGEQPCPGDVPNAHRSEARRVGKEFVSTCRSGWSHFP